MFLKQRGLKKNGDWELNLFVSKECKSYGSLGYPTIYKRASCVDQTRQIKINKNSLIFKLLGIIEASQMVHQAKILLNKLSYKF